MKRPGVVVAIGLFVGTQTAVSIFFVPDDFARAQLPWMLAVMPMFIVGAVLILRAPTSSIGWLLFGIAVAGSFGNLPGFGDDPGGHWYGPLGAALSTFGISLLPLLVLLFPDGSLPSKRWRTARVLIIGSATFGAVLAVMVGGWGGEASEFVTPSPLYESTRAFTEPASGVYFVLFGSGMFAALGSLVVRYRGGSAEVRLQLKWLLVSTAYLAITLIVVTSTVGPTGQLGAWQAFAMAAGMASVPIAIGFAVLRYRLYDIDLVISRAFVYGSLAVFIGAVYVSIVVGIGALFGAGDEPNTGLAIAATAFVAVAFQPLRRGLERVANRLVYGRKATPYQVLSDFSRRVAATDDSLLGEAARSLVQGTGAEHAAVWVTVRDQLIKTAQWPAQAEADGNQMTSFPIERDGAELGVLTLSTPAGQRLSGEDDKLAAQVAAGMGLALRNQLLTERLQTRVEELRTSRRRLVAVQDETRRKLERDLHDGAQQQLVALKVKLGLGRAIADKDGAPQTAELLGQLAEEADEAVDAMRDFARGVYPPLLEAEGLGTAVAAQARRLPVSVTVDSDGLRRYRREVEATIYFCVLEALNNVAKYSNADAARVALTHNNGTVTFAVTDDGTGFNLATTPRGAGLTNMADRVDAVAGTLDVDSTPGAGTTIRGSIPVGVGHDDD